MSHQDAARHIGIRHRTKQTAGGEMRPTEVAVAHNGSVTTYTLPSEQAELDWVHGQFPRLWEQAEKDEDLSGLSPHHIRIRNKQLRIPASYDGLRPGDTVVLAMGGSGDRLAYALSRRAEEVGATVLRVPPFILKDARGERDKDEDTLTLAEIGREALELTHSTYVRERETILLRERYRAWRDAQKDRIRCEQRLHQRFIGSIFCQPEGLYPEGALEDLFAAEKANDAVLQALVEEETERFAEMEEALHALPVWQQILADVEGMGTSIAARLVAAIGDVRRFATDAKLKAYCGVHVRTDGTFPRKRTGEVANWNGTARQALYLFGEQMNRRPGSHWGAKQRQYKQKLREKHPTVEEVNGKKRYTNAHIHRMATWRALSRFTRWLWREWTRLEEQMHEQDERAVA